MMIGFGSSLGLTRDALRDQLRATYYDEDRAAEDKATRVSISCLLYWMSVHCHVPLEETTQLVPKRFTHGPVPWESNIDDTVQVFVAVKEIKSGLGFRWPLEVHGFVAVRDNVDCKRNVIFCRDRNSCETLPVDIL